MPPEKFHQPATESNGGLPLQTNAPEELPRIRTYQSDVEELMKKRDVSKATIAIAEGVKRVKREEETAKNTSAPTEQAKVFRISSGLPLTTRINIKLVVLASIGILTFGGIGVGAFFYFRTAPKPPEDEPKTNIPQSVGITLQGEESRAGMLKALTDGITALSVPQNGLQTIPVMVGVLPLTTEGFLDRLGATAPPSLTRALGTVPTLGVHGWEGGQPFLLFSVSSYDYAFAGMLKWEETLLDTIGPLFGVSSRDILSSSGSTTAEALSNTIAIKDVIIRNKDARAVFDPQGTIVFLYSFIDKQTLVFTTNEDTLKLLINKAGGGKLR